MKEGRLHKSDPAKAWKADLPEAIALRTARTLARTDRNAKIDAHMAAYETALRAALEARLLPLQETGIPVWTGKETKAAALENRDPYTIPALIDTLVNEGGQARRFALGKTDISRASFAMVENIEQRGFDYRNDNPLAGYIGDNDELLDPRPTGSDAAIDLHEKRASKLHVEAAATLRGHVRDAIDEALDVANREAPVPLRPGRVTCCA